MKVYFDPLDAACKNITGAVSDDQQIKFKIKLSGAKTCHLILRCDDGKETSYKMKKCREGFCLDVDPLEKGLYWYSFLADGVKIGKNWLGFGEIGDCTTHFELLVYSHTQSYPKGFCGGVMYQIMPDRFAKADGYGDSTGKRLRYDWGGTPEFKPIDGKIKNDDFFGGNFEGIRQKLDYLKELGVTVIYMCPISEAYSNHKYDTADYMSVDDMFGSEEDFKELINKAKEKGMKIVIDGVYNHTGSDSIYFNRKGRYAEAGAFQSKDSKYHNWYDFPLF